MKLCRYYPCPVLVHPAMHPSVPGFRKAGLICMGPYANDMWYVFYPKGVPAARTGSGACMGGSLV